MSKKRRTNSKHQTTHSWTTRQVRVTADILSSSQQALLHRGQRLLASRSFDDLIDLTRLLVAEVPEAFGPRHLLAIALFKRGYLPEARSEYEELAARFPDKQEPHTGLAGVLATMGYQEEAFVVIQRALEIDPKNPSAILNLAEILRHMGNWHDAKEAYAVALSLDPTNAKLRLQHGMAMVALGDWRAGWAEMEHREFVDGAQLYPEPISSPRWYGNEPINGKRLLISHEQGLGDSIMLARFARKLHAMGAIVHLRTMRPLVGLLAQAEGVSTCTELRSPMPEHDLHVPLMSLPTLLDVHQQDVSGEPYLQVPGSCPAAIRSAIPDDSQLNVVISWSGNPNHPNNHRRSIRGELLRPLFDVPGIRLLALQISPSAESVLPADLYQQVTDVGVLCDAFVDSAHALQRVDVVLCVDSAVAHLAGALGVQTLLCLPFASEYRWGIDGNRCIWYESVSLLRQPQAFNWDYVIRHAADRLRALANSKQRLRGL